MMQGTTQRMQMPGDLQSPRAKLVYLYLSTHGSATVTELQEDLEMKKLSLYSILRTLERRGLVSKESDRYAPV